VKRAILSSILVLPVLGLDGGGVMEVLQVFVRNLPGILLMWLLFFLLILGVLFLCGKR